MKAKILVEHEIEYIEGEPSFCSPECKYYDVDSDYCELFNKALKYFPSVNYYERCYGCYYNGRIKK